MVDFAGWSMPVTYDGVSIVDEVKHTRTQASIFDVSHMLQFRIGGPKRISFLERVTVADLQSLKPHESCLSMFMNSSGGIVDDTILNKQDDHVYVVSNAGCADKDISFIRSNLEEGVTFDIIDDCSLLALQGPKSSEILQKLTKQNSLQDMPFMTTRKMSIDGMKLHVSRSGYTGEDGFEIQVSSSEAPRLADILLEHANWAGLGSRDTLRLEAGLCLYGHDIDEQTTPVEAGLSWTISKRRRSEGGFHGADKVQSQLGSPKSVLKRRIGLLLGPGAPAREGYAIQNESGEEVGKVTSGSPSPTLKKNIAMAYVKAGNHKQGTKLQVVARGKPVPAEVVKMPFVPSQYHK